MKELIRKEKYKNKLVAAEVCAGCSYNVDMRCPRGPGCPFCGPAKWHRVTDCLIPLYGVIEGARKTKLKQ